MHPIVKGLLARVASLVPSAIALLAATRLVLEEYGVDVYNAFVLVFSTMVLIPLNDLGAGAALTSAVAEYGARARRTRRVALTAMRILAASGLGLGAAALLFSALGWWDEVLGEGAFASGAFGLALAAYGLSFVPGLGQSTLLGANKNHLNIVVQAFMAPCTCAGAALCVVLELEPAWVVAVPGMSVLLISLVNAWVAGRATKLRLLRLVPRIVRRRRYPGERIRAIAGPALVVLLTAPISLQSDRLVLSHFSTAPEVAKYSLGMQIFAPLVALIPAAARPLWPMFTRARAEGTKPMSLVKVVPAFAFVTAIGAGVLCVVTGPIGEVIGDDKVDVGLALPLALAGLVVVQSIAVPLTMALMYPAGLRMVATLSAIGMPLNLGLSIVAAGPLGAPGPLVVSASVMFVVQVVPSALYLRRHPIVAPAEPPVAVEPDVADVAAGTIPPPPPPPPPPPQPALGTWWAFQLLDSDLSVADGTRPRVVQEELPFG